MTEDSSQGGTEEVDDKANSLTSVEADAHQDLTESGVVVLESMVDFEREVLAAPYPVLLAFTAVWCAPCAWLEPYLTEAAREGEGKLRVFKVDVDTIPEAAARFRIGSVPIVLLFRGGDEVERSVGVEPHRIRAMAGLR